jgi:NADP-dependent 3-hydroxy acid dehydrogenase YdfG
MPDHRSRKDDVIQHTANELSKKHQAKCLAVAGDVRNYEDVERVVSYGYEHFGG